jgi:hypothetical protein
VRIIRPVSQKLFVMLMCFFSSAGLVVMPGCTLYIKTNDGNLIRTTSAEFNEYAEQVFRLHNEVTTNLAYTLDEIEFSGEDDEVFNGLIEADDRMLQACSAIDKVAVARRDGEKVSLKQLNTAAKFIPDCEKATLEAAKMIAAIESARNGSADM